MTRQSPTARPAAVYEPSTPVTRSSRTPGAVTVTTTPGSGLPFASTTAPSDRSVALAARRRRCRQPQQHRGDREADVLSSVRCHRATPLISFGEPVTIAFPPSLVSRSRFLPVVRRRTLALLRRPDLCWGVGRWTGPRISSASHAVQSSPAGNPGTPVFRPTATRRTARRCEPWSSHRSRNRRVKATDGSSFMSAPCLTAAEWLCVVLEVNQGSLYPALQRLEKQGLIPGYAHGRPCRTVPSRFPGSSPRVPAARCRRRRPPRATGRGLYGAVRRHRRLRCRLRRLTDEFGTVLALAAYNAGPGAVRR